MNSSRAKKSIIAGMVSAGIGFFVTTLVCFFQNELFPLLYNCKMIRIEDGLQIGLVILYTYGSFLLLAIFLITAVLLADKKTDNKKIKSIIIFLSYIIFSVVLNHFIFTKFGYNTSYMSYYTMMTETVRIFMIIGQACLFYGLARMGFEEKEEPLPKEERRLIIIKDLYYPISLCIFVIVGLMFLNFHVRTTESIEVVITVLLIIFLNASLFNLIKARCIINGHLYKQGFMYREKGFKDAQADTYINAVLSGETEYVIYNSSKKMHIISKQWFAEYMALIGDYTRLQNVLVDLESNKKAKKIGIINRAHDLLEENYESIIKKSEEEISSFSKYTQHIQIAKAYYWKGFSLYKLGKNSEAYESLKEADRYGYDTIYQDKAREIFPQLANEERSLPLKPKYKWNKADSWNLIYAIVIIISLFEMFSPGSGRTTKSALADELWISGKRLYVVDEQTVETQAEAIYIDTKNHKVYYTILKKKNDKFIVEDLTNRDLDIETSPISFDFYVEKIKGTKYYSDPMFSGIDKYAVYATKVDVNDEYIDSKVEYIGTVGENDEYYLYKILE